MSDYQSRMRAWAIYGPGAISRVVEDNRELFLSVREKEFTEKVASATKLQSDLPTPSNESEAYSIISRLAGVLFAEGKIAIPSYGLSTLGQNDMGRLINLAYPPPPVERSTDPREIFKDVIETFKAGPEQFNKRRKEEPDFLKRSDDAQKLRVLR
jgi:hypothetical protein